MVDPLLHRVGDKPWLYVFGQDTDCPGGRVLERCSDFLLWPSCDEELALRLSRFRRLVAQKRTRSDRPEVVDEFARLNLIGRSPRFQSVLREVEQISKIDAPVLVRGESGTGKELIARAIHHLGARREMSFVPVNCGAIPENLIESEFFGHERGAFTDAKQAHPGLVSQANGGTLFLDEIESLSLKGQVALLRFLQDQEFRPLGGKHARRGDVRVVSATNADLEAMIDRGAFRQDLYFRLNVFALDLPPLRDRGDDVITLAQHFLAHYHEKYRMPEIDLSQALLSWMKTHPWPGNVRELENWAHRAVVCGRDGGIRLPPGISDPPPGEVADWPASGLSGSFNQARMRVVENFERQYLALLLRECGGNVTLAAKRAGKERRSLGKLLKKHGLVPARA
jgi:DNA-binding NtrC family response regulator